MAGSCRADINPSFESGRRGIPVQRPSRCRDCSTSRRRPTVSAPWSVATHLLLFALFGAYSGVILFFIYSFANPFPNPGRLEPRPFMRLLEGDIGKGLPANRHSSPGSSTSAW